jgi:endonuclease/exonuclease/phosphatase family metal-dependent hydrolase
MKKPLEKAPALRPSILKLGLCLTVLAIAGLVTCVRSRIEKVVEDNRPVPVQPDARENKSDSTSAPIGGDGTAEIASWNVSWLSDKDNSGLSPRTERDYKAIAGIIEQIRAEICCLQEIKNPEALARITRYLPEYFLSETRDTGTQDPAILWDSRVAEISDVRLLTELDSDGYDSAETPENFSMVRHPLAARFTLGDFDGTVVVVHLRYPRDARSRSFHREEIRRIQEWILRFSTTSGNDPDVLVMGDWNVEPRKISDWRGLKLHAPKTPTLLSGNGVYDYGLGSSDTDEEILQDRTETPGLFRDVFEQFKVSDHKPMRIFVNTRSGTRDR